MRFSGKLLVLTAAALAPALLPWCSSSSEAAAGRARGIDVSEYQGAIDWGRVRASGISFAIARVSDGVHHPDRDFARNWHGMKAHGLVRGVYQFFRPDQSAIAQ